MINTQINQVNDSVYKLSILRNDNLFEQVKALFKNWLMSYKPFSIENWRTGIIGKTFEFHDSKRIPLSESGRDQIEMSYPYYDAT